MDDLVHVIDGYAAADRRGTVRAICGRLTQDHEWQEPTCPDCRRLHDEDNELMLALAREREVNDGR